MKKKLFVVLGVLILIILGNIFTFNMADRSKYFSIEYKDIKNQNVIFQYDVYNYDTLYVDIDIYKDNNSIYQQRLGSLRFNNSFYYTRLNPFTMYNELTGIFHDTGTFEYKIYNSKNIGIVTHTNNPDYTHFTNVRLDLDFEEKYEDDKELLESVNQDLLNIDFTKLNYVKNSSKNNVLGEFESGDIKMVITLEGKENEVSLDEV